ADDDDGQLAGGLIGAQAREQLDAAHAREHDVQDGQVDVTLASLEDLEGLLGRGGLDDVVALAPEHQIQGAPDVALVVDDQDGGRGGGALLGGGGHGRRERTTGLRVPGAAKGWRAGRGLGTRLVMKVSVVAAAVLAGLAAPLAGCDSFEFTGAKHATLTY